VKPKHLPDTPLAWGKMMLCLTALSLLVLNEPCRAQEGRDYFGVGGQSCGVWVDARKRNEARSQGNWVLGYFSALNLWGVIGRDNDALKNVDANAIYHWLDNYCQANPLETIASAVGNLARELDRRVR
jgi:hypothetical protein